MSDELTKVCDMRLLTPAELGAIIVDQRQRQDWTQATSSRATRKRSDYRCPWDRRGGPMTAARHLKDGRCRSPAHRPNSIGIGQWLDTPQACRATMNDSKINRLMQL
jgi:hypothetical protein